MQTDRQTNRQTDARVSYLSPWNDFVCVLIYAQCSDYLFKLLVQEKKK